MPQPPEFWRSPRLRTNLPDDTIEMPSPSQEEQEPDSLLPTLLPVGLSALVMTGIGLASGMSSMLMFSVPMMLVSAVAGVYTHFDRKKKAAVKNTERAQKYKSYLEQLEKQLRSAHERQVAIRTHESPSPQECLGLVQAMRRQLWARNRGDDDYLAVRVGVGGESCSVTLKEPQSRDPFNPDPLVQMACDLAARYRTVSNVPVLVSLAEAGVAGITGPRKDLLHLTRSAIMGLTTHHSPSTVKIAAIYERSYRSEWEWMRWLPHVWSDDGRHRLMAYNEEPEDNSIHELLADINELLTRRAEHASSRSAGESVQFEFDLVVFLDAPDATEGEAVVQRLQAEGPRLGIYTVFLQERVSNLSQGCNVAVRVGLERPFVRDLRSQASTVFHPDTAPQGLADSFALAMAPVVLRQPASAGDLPEVLTLMEMFGAQKVEDLEVASRWEQSQTVRKSLATAIGMRAGSEELVFDLHEREHGPNGLVAGMVGAGKSELLQTVVASLATNYHPHKLSFVLIDYKGGGMADPFVGLPHTLGTITNLQEAGLAARAVTSLNVESERRQRLFREAGVNHIDDYQKLYYQNKVSDPIPYLVIIVDEFAEMKTEQPEVAKEFVRIARLGRALGFRLILAMQKPAGIVDGQIEANTRFRLSLRVAQREDSQAMLKRPEAAYLTGVGRAYFQVGANELFQMFQVAWSGAPYDPIGSDAEDPYEISRVYLDGGREALYRPSRTGSGGEEVTQLEALTRHLVAIAETQGIEPLSGPWLPPLPDSISVQMLGVQSGWDGQAWPNDGAWMYPMVGLGDDPGNQQQIPVGFNLGREGHMMVFGAPGYGKTVLLQTLIMSLARSHSPDDLHMYMLDFGGRLLKMFEQLPQCGGAITADETERVERLLQFLLREMDRRKELFGQAGVSTLPEYRSAASQPIPAILVVLDNYASFSEAFEDAENSIVQIAREAGNLGIHMVLTGSSSSAIRYKVSSNITQVAALNLVDSSEYGALLGRTDGMVPAALAGRGLLQSGNGAMEFQTALPTEGNTDAQRNARLREEIAQMAESWRGSAPYAIRNLPEVVTLGAVLADAAHLEQLSSTTVPLGLIVRSLDHFDVDLDAGPHFLVAGPAQSGKSTLLLTWARALINRLDAAELSLYVLDSQRESLGSLRGLKHTRAYSCTQDEADVVVGDVEGLIASWRSHPDAATRPLATVILVDDAFDPYDDGVSDPTKERLAGLMRQGRGMGLHIVLAGASGDLMSKGWNEPVKSLKATNAGFMLGISDDSVYNLHLPYSERDQILPSGEAYYVSRGSSIRVKLALPTLA